MITVYTFFNLFINIYKLNACFFYNCSENRSIYVIVKNNNSFLSCDFKYFTATAAAAATATTTTAFSTDVCLIYGF